MVSQNVSAFAGYVTFKFGRCTNIYSVLTMPHMNCIETLMKAFKPRLANTKLEVPIAVP